MKPVDYYPTYTGFLNPVLFTLGSFPANQKPSNHGIDQSESSIYKRGFVKLVKLPKWKQ